MILYLGKVVSTLINIQLQQNQILLSDAEGTPIKKSATQGHHPLSIALDVLENMKENYEKYKLERKIQNYYLYMMWLFLF